ncbi:hypothetical protein EDB85DRAFT_1900374 [Lactarius pseudohatsudake]|nr:hypothetical protein EDB85DRAFT_1900374 [Lactarius pseudohatsudake]
MSRYQVLQSYVEITTMNTTTIYNVKEEEPDYSICNPATRTRVDTDDEPDEADPEYVPAEAVKEYEDSSSEDETRVEEELRLGAEGRAEEVLQEDDQEDLPLTSGLKSLRHIEAWRAAGMEDDDEEVLEDTVGSSWKNEEDPRDDAREQYGWHAEDFKQDPPAEEYSEDELIDEYYYSDDADAQAEKRVEPPPQDQEEGQEAGRREKRPVTAPRRVLIRAKSPTPTWQKKYISKFGKEALKQAREMGIPDYILEADAEGETLQKKSTAPTRQTCNTTPPIIPKRDLHLKERLAGKVQNICRAELDCLSGSPDAMDLLRVELRPKSPKLSVTMFWTRTHAQRLSIQRRTEGQDGFQTTLNNLEASCFKSQKPFTAIQHPSPPTEEDVTGMLADLQIRRTRAVKAGNFKSAQDIDWRMSVIDHLQKTMKPKLSLQDLEEDLEHVEARLSRALVSGNTPEIKSLDLAANKLAEELLKRNVDYRFHTAADLLVQRGRCSRKEGNVTIRPTARPERPLGTAVRRSQADYAEEEAQISRLVAEHAQAPKAKSPVGYYVYGSAQKSQEYWE